MNRYFYKSAVKDFVRASEETIFGQIAMKDEGDSGAEQKYAWSEEIDIIYHGVTPRYGASTMKQIEVVAAIIHDDKGRIFATQRGYGDYKDGWEFPGGKMEPGETPEEALKREIREELETKIVVERLVQTVEYDYPQFHLKMHCFWCRIESGSLTLKEHEAARWLTKDELDSVQWLPADLEVINELKAK